MSYGQLNLGLKLGISTENSYYKDPKGNRSDCYFYVCTAHHLC